MYEVLPGMATGFAIYGVSRLRGVEPALQIRLGFTKFVRAMADHSLQSDDGNLPATPHGVWVVVLAHDDDDDDVIGRLGDARVIADALHESVSVLTIVSPEDFKAELATSWIHHGADFVHCATTDGSSTVGKLAIAEDFWCGRPPRLVLGRGSRVGRAWSARLAQRLGWKLVSPALLVRAVDDRLVATQLDMSGRRARQIELPCGQPAIVSISPGVAQPLPVNASRQGEVARFATNAAAGVDPVRSTVRQPANPQTADIGDLPRLVAGGRGVGCREGFELLGRVAQKLGAGVAASRMAVDLGWIEQSRQVGQTGKTVKPELYLACGISGALHHWGGMSESRHIVTINSDPRAPLLAKSHLAIVGDLHGVLGHLLTELEKTT